MRALQEAKGASRNRSAVTPARRLPAMRALQVVEHETRRLVRTAGTETARHEGTASTRRGRLPTWNGPARRLPAMRALQGS